MHPIAPSSNFTLWPAPQKSSLKTHKLLRLRAVAVKKMQANGSCFSLSFAAIKLLFMLSFAAIKLLFMLPFAAFEIPKPAPTLNRDPAKSLERGF
jgi:hypothetical protein